MCNGSNTYLNAPSEEQQQVQLHLWSMQGHMRGAHGSVDAEGTAVRPQPVVV